MQMLHSTSFRQQLYKTENKRVNLFLYCTFVDQMKLATICEALYIERDYNVYR